MTPGGARLVGVNGVELECVDEGSSTPVVFSHGGASDHRYWEPQRATFAVAKSHGVRRVASQG